MEEHLAEDRGNLVVNQAPFSTRRTAYLMYLMSAVSKTHFVSRMESAAPVGRWLKWHELAEELQDKHFEALLF